MRILLLNQFYKPDVAATGQLLADLAVTLVHRGHEVHVVCSCSKYNGGKLMASGREIIDGVQVHRVKTTGFGRKKLLGRMVDYLSFYFSATWRALRMPKPDVCVSLTTPPFISLIGLLLAKVKGSRNMIWVMDVYPEIAVAYEVLRKQSLIYRFLSRLNRLLYCNSEAIISLGDVMSERLVKSGALRDKITVVHNWVPQERFWQLAGKDSLSLNQSHAQSKITNGPLELISTK